MLRPSHVFVLSTLLIGCGNKDAVKEIMVAEKTPTSSSLNEGALEHTDASITVKRAVEVKEDFSNFDQFIENLNKWEITARVSASDQPSILKCNGITYNHGEFTSTNWVTDAGQNLLNATISNVGLSGNAKLNKLKCIVYSESREKILEQDVTIKRDYLVKGSKTAKEIGLPSGTYDIGSLILAEGSTLVSEGANLSIKSDLFISGDESSIRTFNDKGNTTPNTHGHSGGNIVITSKKSIGSLKVFLLGKNGGENTEEIHSYKDLKANCETTVGTIHTYSFNTEGAAGYRGGDVGSFNLKSPSQRMDVSIIKKDGEGLGGPGGKNFNPSNSLNVSYEQVKLPGSTLNIGDYYNGSQICDSSVENILTYKTIESITITYVNSKLLFTLQIMQKAPELLKPNRGPWGKDGARDNIPSCIFDLTNNIQECF